MTKYRVSREPVVQPLDNSIKHIPLTQGQVAIVDASDYEWLMQWPWCATWRKSSNTFYAVRAGRNDNGKRTLVLMHRFILRAKLPHVDHKNLNGLDNRRSNLRESTHSQNHANATKYACNTSGYKGVFIHNSGWMARIKVKGKPIYLGYFSTKEMAAQAYNQAALEHFGEFARLNQLPPSDIQRPVNGSEGVGSHSLLEP